MLYSTVNEIFFWIFWSTNSVVSGGIIVGIYRRFKIAESPLRILWKSGAAFIIWAILNIVILIDSLAFFYGDTVEQGERKIVLESATIYFLMFFGGWILAGIITILLINRIKSKNFNQPLKR